MLLQNDLNMGETKPSQIVLRYVSAQYLCFYRMCIQSSNLVCWCWTLKTLFLKTCFRAMGWDMGGLSYLSLPIE